MVEKTLIKKIGGKNLKENKVFRKYIRCVNRCENCNYDINDNHYPNNRDCPNYRPAFTIEFYVHPKKRV